MKKRINTPKQNKPNIKQFVERVILPNQQRGLTDRQMFGEQFRKLKRIQQLREFKEAQELQNTNLKPIREDFEKRKEIARIQNALKERNLSENTKMLLERILRVKNKKYTDDNRMQRVIRERRIIQDNTDILKAENTFKNAELDFTGVKQDNILLAPNTFKENPENNLLKNRRRNVLDTRENTLRF